jgi:hypothetical protein
VWRQEVEPTMSSATIFKRMFAGAILEVDDLFLLESFQIAYLPGWVPEREFGAVLHARPAIARYLVTRCPEVSGYVAAVLREHAAPVDPEELAEFERVVKRPGTILHCPGTAAGVEDDTHAVLIGAPWNYRFAEYDEADGRKRKYWKNL